MLKKFHKIFGVSIALIILHLSITGILLMFPSFFNLYDKYYNSEWMLGFFDMYKHSDVKRSSSDSNLIFVASNLIIEDELINLGIESVLSGVKLKKNIIVASPSSLLAITEQEIGFDVRIIKEFENALVGMGFAQEGNLVIESSNNKFIVKEQELEFIFLSTDDNYKRIFLSTISKDDASDYLNLIQGPGVQALRLITDLHNGRFFGIIAVLIIVISSFGVIFLAVSGTYMALGPLIKVKYRKLKRKK